MPIPLIRSNEMDALKEAGLAMAEELEKEWGWSIGDDPDSAEKFADLAVRYFAPLLDSDKYKQARIAALKAELTELEA